MIALPKLLCSIYSRYSRLSCTKKLTPECQWFNETNYYFLIAVYAQPSLAARRQERRSALLHSVIRGSGLPVPVFLFGTNWNTRLAPPLQSRRVGEGIIQEQWSASIKSFGAIKVTYVSHAHSPLAITSHMPKARDSDSKRTGQYGPPETT